MVGATGTGKTSLVRRFVHQRFSEKYHTTIGVKIDRKSIEVDGTTLNLMLWDLEGRSDEQDISPSYLRGAAGVIFVVDGTRRVTLDHGYDLQELVTSTVGAVPAVVALNKRDLTDTWALNPDDHAALSARGAHVFETSAKTGEAVEEAFHWLGSQLRGNA